MNFSLTHLCYFRDAANFKSVGMAAKKNFVSSSAVSQAIRSLEQSFSTTLLVHEKRVFRLTDSGEELLKRSQSLIQEAFNLNECMSNQTRENAGEVIIACQQSFAQNVLPKFMAVFNKKYPNIRVHWIFGITDEVKEMLRTRQANIVLSADNISFDTFEELEVLSGNYVLIAKKGTTKPDPVFILTSETQETSQFHKNYRKRFQTGAKILMEVDSWGVIKKLCAEGLGIGLVPDYLLRFDKAQSAVRIVDMGIEPSPYRVSAYYIGPRATLRRSCGFVLDELALFFKANSKVVTN